MKLWFRGRHQCAYQCAVKRAMIAMPHSPRKRAAVVKCLILTWDTGDTTADVRHSNKLSEETNKAVLYFNDQSAILWTAPGRKDFVIVRTTTVKERIQKKFLMLTVDEAYGLFTKEHPNLKVGCAKFADLRPQHATTASFHTTYVSANTTRTWGFFSSRCRLVY